MNKKIFVVVDVMALAYKAYFAFISRPLSNSAGEPTSAIYGYITQLFKIIEDTKPDYLAAAFDSKEKTFRHERYDLYKSSRSVMPEDLIPQIQRIKEVTEAFNIPIYILPGYEADDLVGTAVRIAENNGLFSYAVTPDKDYVQLVTENVNLVIPGKSGDDLEIIDIAKVQEKYGFAPSQMTDYLALVGDSSDDIPGVAGVGPKTATPLIQKYGSVEALYENIEDIDKVGLKKKLIESKENAFLSKELATIVTETPFKINLEDAKFNGPNTEKLLQLFNELDFKHFPNRLKKIFTAETVEELNAQVDDTIAEPDIVASFEDVDYKLIKDIKEAEQLVKKLEQTELFVFDTETDSLDVLNINLAGVAFSIKEGEGYFVATNPFTQKDDLFAKDYSDRITLPEFIKIFKGIFENPKIKKVCQNGKYDIAVLRTIGIDVENFYFDTMLASYILDQDEKHGMDFLSEKYLGHTPIPISTLIGDKKDAKKIFDADLSELAKYSSEDADVTLRLFNLFKESLKKEKLDKLAHEIEFALVPVLEDMERTGVKLDQKGLKEFSDKLGILTADYTKTIYELAGETFNINSPKQLQVILFENLKLPTTKKTKTGFSTDAGSLEILKGQHPIIDTILDYRQTAKLKSTYADALPNLINPKTGRLHTTYNQTVASTGRLSSLNPNLQNIPIRTTLGKEIRKAFIPRDENHVLFSADYSQIELRIMASICSDEGLMKSFINGEDIHKSTAALVFMVNPEDVTPDMRRKAKEVNFGILYGIGAFGLRTRLGITQAHAKDIIDTYFSTFKQVKKFMDDSISQAKEKGYAETLLGRRRYLKNINSGNRVVRQFEERVAINMPIQGTAADMIKIAMINIHNEMKKRKLESKMVLQVHDELVFDALKSEIDELKPLVINLMETALPLNVPVVVETGVGNNWLEAH
ncbi:MAG: DNA polymerase I [Bacteroidetes bacterium]|nr:DNA polymerase I [Bacteroidota bacterium]